MSLSSTDLETIIEVTGYHFNIPSLLEGVDDIAIAHGVRNRDKLLVVAKLSHQPLRLEREFHIVQRLYRQSSAKELLCKPIDKITLPNGLIAFIYEDDGNNNRLDKCQPLKDTPEINLEQEQTLNNAKEQSVPLDMFLEFAIQCCDCLEMIHKHQIVHGEIKLNAFLWPDNKRVKIWNFGSGSRSLEMSFTSEGWRKIVHRNGANNFLQMLTYMSPEQTGRTTFQPDHRTDLYSLGITFFVTLTRSLPFSHNSPMEIVHNVLNKKLPFVHQVCPETPMAISMIIKKLTSKSPDERYTSAHGLREDLKECQRQSKETKSISLFPLGKHDIASIFTLPNNGCFGRSTELALINSIIRRTAFMCGSKVQRRDDITTAVALPSLKSEDQSYKRVNNNRNNSRHRKRLTEIIAIYGNAGVGKSTLVRNVQQSAREYGYIAIAKFDTRQPTPYGCLLRCLSIFLKNILSEPAHEIERFSRMLKEQLGAETISQLPTLLVDNVPELSTFLDQPSLTRRDGDNTSRNSSGCEFDMGGGEIKVRFHSAFIEIFHVMVNFKFVTLFLEDLHQADEASIELLESLISAKLKFLVILTYRSNEVSQLIIKLLSNQDSVVSYVKIENLGQTALMDLVRTTMHRLEEIDLVLLTPLVDFILKRSRGNPFYACQMLMTLEKKNVIYFTWEKKRWEYNLQEIDKQLLLEMGEDTDGDLDIDFLVRRLSELPRDGRRFLKWASFIGNHFNYETVRNLLTENDDVMDDADESEEETDEENTTNPPSKSTIGGRKYDAINGLQSAIQHGFIQACNNDEFRFTHDRYSQAAMMLASTESRDVFHLRIASHFMYKDNVDKFWVADHVKAAIHLIKEYRIKSCYRSVLVQAGNKAFDSGAHKLAFSYYSAAQELLTTIDNPWKDGEDAKYSETLHLYTRLAEISWFMDYDFTRGYLNTILSHARSAIDRAAAYRVQHRYRWSRTGSQESAPILLECLHELGVDDIKMDLSEKDLEDLYNVTKNEVLQVGLNEVLKLPICESRLIRTRFSIMEELCLWAYWTNDMRAMLSVGSRFVLKTLRNGTTPSTGVGFVFFGIAAMQLFKAYEFAEQIGAIGVALCNTYGGNSESGRARYLYSAFLSSWKYSYHDSIPISRLAMKQALLGGDRIYSTFAYLYVVLGNLLCGENMADSLREAKNCLEETNTLGETVGTSILAVAIVRSILAVQGKTQLSEQYIFNDKKFQEDSFLKTVTEEHADPKAQLYYYFSLKSVMLTFFGFDKTSAKLSSEYTHMADILPSFRHTHLMFFFRCISLIRLARMETTGLEYMEVIQKSRARLVEWADNSHPSNLQMCISGIDAELASLKGNHMKAQKLYDLAIRQAKQGKWPIETSYMQELAGEYYLRNEITTVGYTLIENAIAGYRHIGMYGKVDQLEAKYKDILNDIPVTENKKDVSVQTESYQNYTKRESISDLSLPDPYAFSTEDDKYISSSNGMTSTPEETLLTLDVVDLASILKSSQVISSEMNFDLLMKQMLAIILENSGAESGVIIVKENTSFLIVGCGSQTNGCEIFSTPKMLSEEADSIITRVAHYAIHSQESLFIHDVKQDSRFSDCTTLSKACICTPIIHKSAIVGCIYIEGAVGSLTSRHEIVLRLLSQQIGISVTNALLFKSIQKVTYANVKMIENQKSALEEARKSKEAALHAMKLKADFLANMSHELRTPFSGFYGMISLLSETSLDAEQQDIVNTAKESCEMLLKIIDDLLNFSKLEAGKVVLDLGPLVVEEVIADTIEILSSLAARKGLELAYIVEPEVPHTIIADSSRVRQVLTNLLGNAIKFTHQGGVVIKCHLAPTEGELAKDENLICLKFEVIDTGIGIRLDQQRQLFEPFSQVDGSTTRMYGGTGLGLSICLQLVRLMMGTVGVESQHNMGSNFWFTVAVHKEPKRIENVNSVSKSASLRFALRNQQILLASHNDSNAKMVRSLLSDFKMKITTDIQRAVAQALQGNYPILILDIPPKPHSSIAHQLQSVDDDPECELHIVLLYTPSTDGHKVAAEATNSSSDRRGRLVKMAKPVRRTKLLRLLQQVLDQQRVSPTPILQTPLGNRMKDYFGKDELSWYSEKPVLIAEDNMVAQKLLRKQLEKMGFTVESANNGEEAVNLWLERPPNHFCIGFFDHHMPKCDGVEATKRIRAHELGTGSRLPIVALTADIQASAKDVCVEAGMDGYLTKPLIPKDLATTLRQLNPAIQKHYDTPVSSVPSSPLSIDSFP
ncbi:hypothetical protein EDC94DRAFT_564880 [Helicostylum pulchrum]|nr:hypothetical protein EDC94DRAFT_564880 [Helicostylum pulchrum]